MRSFVWFILFVFSLVGVKRIRLHTWQRGLVWNDGEFQGIVGSGVLWFFDPLGKKRIELHNRRSPWIKCDDLSILSQSGRFGDDVEFLKLTDNQRALLWFDDIFQQALGPGLYAWWKGMINVRYEVFDITAGDGELKRNDLSAILDHPMAAKRLKTITVAPGSKTALYRDGAFVRMLEAGRYTFWNGIGELLFRTVDIREQVLDISGQEMLTSDKLALRMNIVLTVRVVDAIKNINVSEDPRQALYREAQLLLRGMVGGRELDTLMDDKEALSGEMEKALRGKAAGYGYEVISFGVRDIILPGEIKNLLIKATEAKKASEAATIVRREETAAMRHQLNTARLLADNPVLMRLREWETLEKVADKGTLNVVLGDKGLTDKVVNLL